MNNAGGVANNSAASVGERFQKIWSDVMPLGYHRLFGRLAGSRAYGTERPDSDWDWAGVYVAPTTSLFTLESPRESITRAVGDGNDWSFHEVGSFLSILLKGNANALDALFAPPDTMVKGDGIYCDFWNDVRRNRKKFLSLRAVQQYVAYAHGQLKKIKVFLENQTPDDGKVLGRWKDAGHGLRLLYEAKRVASGDEPCVRVSSVEADAVRHVMSGSTTPEAVFEAAQHITTQIDETDKGHLPEEGPREFCNEWLQRLRLASPELCQHFRDCYRGGVAISDG